MGKVTRNRLAFSRAYLCGAMDRVADGGIAWRENLKTQLEDLKINWMDPCHKPIDIGIEDLENREQRRRWKQAGRFDLVANDIKVIRCVDLRLVDLSDFLVVNLDMEVHACGTYEELFLANRQKKPIVVRLEQGKKACPDWLLGVLPHQMIFSTWDEVGRYLRHVAVDDVVDSFNRWYFFNFNGEGDFCNML
jgi:hypothetical protein